MSTYPPKHARQEDYKHRKKGKHEMKYRSLGPPTLPSISKTKEC